MGERKFSVPIPKGLGLWVPLTALLTLGLSTTLIDLYHLPEQEATRAMAKRQRFVVDPATGAVAMGLGSVKSEEVKADEPTETQKPEVHEEQKAEEVKADAHKTEESTSEKHKPEAPETTAITEHPEPEKPATTETPAPEAATPEPAGEHAASEKPTEKKSAEPVAEKPATEAASGETPGTAITEKPAAEKPTAAESSSLPADAPTLRTEPIKIVLDMPPHTKHSLVSAPAPEVTETIDGVRLPKRGDKGVAPSQLYAHPFKRNAEQILISFVVMDVGLDPESIGLLLNLPPEITVAYSPYTRKNMGYSEHLRAMGHEVWTMLPVMSDRYPSDDPGPMGLIAKMPDEEIVRRTREVLGTTLGSVGVVLPPNETISLQKDALAAAFAELEKRGLLVLSTHPSRTVDQLTRDQKIIDITHRADLVLDPAPNESQIRSKLTGLLEAAKEKGEFVVVLSARPQSLKILGEWLKEAKLAAPYELAPLSALYQPKETPVAEAPADDGHGGGEKKEKPKPKPVKKQKVLPQDQYKKPPEGEKGGGGHH